VLSTALRLTRPLRNTVGPHHLLKAIGNRRCKQPLLHLGQLFLHPHRLSTILRRRRHPAMLNGMAPLTLALSNRTACKPSRLPMFSRNLPEAPRLGRLLWLIHVKSYLPSTCLHALLNMQQEWIVEGHFRFMHRAQPFSRVVPLPLVCFLLSRNSEAHPHIPAMRSSSRGAPRVRREISHWLSSCSLIAFAVVQCFVSI
jgi:hypothetical protein